MDEGRVLMGKRYSERGRYGMVSGCGWLDCTIIYILLIIEHNGDVSPENSLIQLKI
jgi:hypothetical protein